MDRLAYLSSLPRKRIAAAALIRDQSDRVCLVKGNYRHDWHLPGGTVESDESPADGCQRELLEELGLVIEPGRLLCVEWVKDAEDDEHGGIQLLYDGGVLDREAIERIVVPPEELDDVRFLAPQDARPLISERNRRRIADGLGALVDGGVRGLDRRP